LSRERGGFTYLAERVGFEPTWGDKTPNRFRVGLFAFINNQLIYFRYINGHTQTVVCLGVTDPT
jgi:hypothetical protein